MVNGSRLVSTWLKSTVAFKLHHPTIMQESTVLHLGTGVYKSIYSNARWSFEVYGLKRLGSEFQLVV